MGIFVVVIVVEVVVSFVFGRVVVLGMVVIGAGVGTRTSGC